MLSRYHLEMMLVMGLLFVILWMIGKKVKNKKNYLRFLSIILLGLEVIRFYFFYGSLNYPLIDSITLHMCTVAVIFTIITGLLQSQLFFDFAYILAITGGVSAIVIPYGILPWWNEFSFIPLQSNVSHLIMLFFMVYAVKNNLFMVKVKRFYLAALGLIVMAGMIHCYNLFRISVSPGSNSNFFWTRFPDPLFPIINHLEFPYHIIILIGLILIFGFIAYLIGEKVQSNPSINKNNTSSLKKSV